MIILLLLGALTSLLAMARVKSWAGVGNLSNSNMILIRLALSICFFLALHLDELIAKKSSFFEAVFVAIGGICGVTITYIATERALMLKKPVFVDEMTFIGDFVLGKFGEKGTRWLFALELMIYFITLLL